MRSYSFDIRRLFIYLFIYLFTDIDGRYILFLCPEFRGFWAFGLILKPVIE